MKQKPKAKLSMVLLIAAGIIFAQSAGNKPASKAADDAYKLLDSGNYTAALSRFQALAASGNTEAMLGLANMYYNGLGVTRDASQVLKWFQKAAEANDIEAQFQLGRAYDIGALGFFPVPVDKTTAAKWYRLAAERGHSDAQLNLATLYSSGEGIAQDDSEATKWVQRSADLGNSAAQDWLGRLYTYGNSVLPKDYVKAYMWYTIAIELSTKSDARPDPGGPPLPPSALSSDRDLTRRQLAADMTRAEIAKAQEMAKAWKPRKPRAP